MNIDFQKLCRVFTAVTGTATILMVAAPASAQSLFELNDNTNIDKLASNGSNSVYYSWSKPSYLVGMAFNNYGSLFVVNTAGTVYQFSGTGVPGSYATVSSGGAIYALAFDKKGNLFVAEGINNVIVEITPANVQTTFATGLNIPAALAFDSTGDLFEADEGSGNIYEFTNHNGTLMPNTNLFASGLSSPAALAFNSSNTLFVVNGVSTGSITAITPSGSKSTFASGLNNPWGLTIDAAGNLYEADSGSGNIYKIAPSGTKSVFETNGVPDVLAFQPQSTLKGTSTNRTYKLNVSMPSPYYSTIVQWSTNIMNPAGWVNIYTNTPPFTFTDSTTATVRYRLYRVILGP